MSGLSLWMNTSHRRRRLGELRQGHDYASRPRTKGASDTGPGPRRPKGHDRLMDKVQPTSNGAPPALCPVCGNTSSAGILRPGGGVVLADYKCASGHIWITKWMVAA